MIRRNPDRAKELETAYDYYIEHFDEISEKYRIALNGEKEENIVAYYVVSITEGAIHKIYNDYNQD